MGARGTGSLVTMDNVTADRSSRVNYEVCRALLSAQIQPNAAELIGRCLTVQMDNEPEHTEKVTWASKGKENVIFFSGQVSHLISTPLNRLSTY